MQVAAFIQNLSEMLYKYVQYIRIHYLLPLIMNGGRNMFLLKNGQWIDTVVHVSPNDIDLIYDVERHTVLEFDDGQTKKPEKPGKPENPGRWPWLSVVVNGTTDISEFFSSLRITTGRTMTPPVAMMLYAHQRGTLYTKNITVMDRSGVTYAG